MMINLKESIEEYEEFATRVTFADCYDLFRIKLSRLHKYQKFVGETIQLTLSGSVSGNNESVHLNCYINDDLDFPFANIMFATGNGSPNKDEREEDYIIVQYSLPITNPKHSFHHQYSPKDCIRLPFLMPHKNVFYKFLADLFNEVMMDCIWGEPK